MADELPEASLQEPHEGQAGGLEVNLQKETEVFERYDLFLELGLQWPALTVDWLMDDASEQCAKLVFATQTDGSEPCRVVVAELTCLTDRRPTSHKTWSRWDMRTLCTQSAVESSEVLHGCRSFGVKPLRRAKAPLRVAACMEVDGDVNRVAACPLRRQVIAARSSRGTVTLLDYKQVTSDSGGFLCSFRYPREDTDGFALAWCPKHRALLGTGGNDGSLSVWDTVSRSPDRPLFALVAHEGSLNDLSFSPCSLSVATAGEDGICTWDMRQGYTKMHQIATKAESFSIDWNPTEEHLLAVGGKGHMVQVWDLRRCQAPLRELCGHTGDASQLQWCPSESACPKGTSSKNLLASSSQDGTAVVWNLSEANHGTEPNVDEAEAPETETLFIHSAHKGSVTDLSWCRSGRLLLCSVSEDYSVQVWQPSLHTVTADEEEAPGAGNPAKRAKR